MIIKGNIQTMTGPVSIEKITAGTVIITGSHVPAKVIDCRKEKAKAALRFKLSPSLTVAEGTGILTAYGVKPAKAGSVMMRKASGSIVPDELIAVDAAEGYELTISDKKTVLISGYGVEVKND